MFTTHFEFDFTAVVVVGVDLELLGSSDVVPVSGVVLDVLLELSVPL